MLTETYERIEFIESVTTRPLLYKGGYYHHVITGKQGVYGFKSGTTECSMAAGQTWLFRFWVNGHYNNLFSGDCQRLA